MNASISRHVVWPLFLLVSVALCAPVVETTKPAASVPAENQTASAGSLESKSTDARSWTELTLEHSRIRDDLLAAEARLSLISEKVFDSQLVVHYQGKIDTPFHLAVLELELDGQQVYRQEFQDAASAQYLKLFDSFVPPGRHSLQLRVWARGPEESPEMTPSYFAAAGMAVVAAQKSACQVRFKTDQDGDVPDGRKLLQNDLEGEWDIEINSEYQTQKR